jgi:ubiquinone/menaquinone biosynthesis C-methylase UbiE
MKKFDPTQAQKLNTAERLTWNNPEEIVRAAQIPAGSRVAEIGCGTGWFTFELEKATRPRGMVFALDMQPAMLQILRAKRDSWERILTLPCGENEFELDDGEVDLVFHANTLHECAEPEKHLLEINRVLKPGGRLVVIEWLWADEESQPGPPNTERIEPDVAKQLLQNAGFKVQSTSDVGPYHYLIQATKKA